MQRKIKMIFNPVANLGNAWTVASSLKSIAAETRNTDWAGTEYPSHASELAMQAAQEGCDQVIALGGDGTVHEVINGLMKIPADQRPALSIVPIGSGNDFSYSLGIPENPETAMRQALNGKPRKVDIGYLRLLDGKEFETFFSNAIGIGFDATVVIRQRQTRYLHGFLGYLKAVMQTIIFNNAGFDLTGSIDEKPINESLLMFVICNGKREGGGFHVAPNAEPDDGHLDIIGLRKMGRLRMLFDALPKFLNGKHLLAPYTLSEKGVSLDIKSSAPLVMHADGEIISGFTSNNYHFEINIIPSALKIIS
jgi:YegS/Rv2252/BmrU family lipid kinase